MSLPERREVLPRPPQDTSPALQPRAFEPLPVGTIRPRGWLHRQLRLQADGLTGHLDKFWPSLRDSRWIGGNAEGWERGPYWLDGLIPLAFQLRDSRLIAKARRWVTYILDHQHPDGWLGAKDDPHAGEGELHLDPWPQFVLFKALIQWQEATGETRVIPALLRAARRIADLLSEEPLRSWAAMRWADLVLSLHWLYERTGETWLLDAAATAQQQGYSWRDHFANFTCTARTRPEQLGELVALPLHGVNNAMGVKSGAVWWRQSGIREERDSPQRALEVLDRWHGQVTGMFAADEHLAGLDPSSGTELCTVVELMFSLETALVITGDPRLADRLERIAYNALPAACTPDMWGHQYHQQPNQVLVTKARRNWVSSGDDANLFGLEPNFGCCTANLHQGWPKFVQHLWMATGDGGLTAVAYGPSEVQTSVQGGRMVTLTTDTEYPFEESISIRIGLTDHGGPVFFPLWLRIPAWAEGAQVHVSGAKSDRVTVETATPGTFYRHKRIWNDGDTVVLHLPMPAVVEERPNHGLAVTCGSLVMALPIGEAWKPREAWPNGSGSLHSQPIPFRGHDWEIHPTSAWNVGCLLTPGRPEEPCPLRVSRIPAGEIPFASEAAPVSVRVPAATVPHWTLAAHSAAPPPMLEDAMWGDYEGSETSEVEWLTLVPYGSAHLRIAEFPAMPDTAFSPDNRTDPTPTDRKI